MTFRGLNLLSTKQLKVVTIKQQFDKTSLSFARGELCLVRHVKVNGI